MQHNPAAAVQLCSPAAMLHQLCYGVQRQHRRFNWISQKLFHIFRQVVAGREDGARQVQAAQVDMEEEDEVTTGERGPLEP